MNITTKVLASLLCLSLLGGCATSRSVLETPKLVAAKAAPQQDNGREVFINMPLDKRVFELNPATANIPSLDPTEDASDAIKARAIGRKRNGFGKALGDILLPEGESVEKLAAASIRQAFIDKGYRIVDDRQQIKADTYIVNADVNKFWSWMNPGFWAITLSTEIATGLVIDSATGTQKVAISVKASDHFQTGVESNWAEVMNKAIKSYIEDLKSKLK